MQKYVAEYHAKMAELLSTGADAQPGGNNEENPVCNVNIVITETLCDQLPETRPCEAAETKILRRNYKM